MNTLLIIQHSLAYGAVLSAFLGAAIIATLVWNREIWLHDFPKDVRDAYGPPRRPETRRQKAIASVVFFGGLLAVLAVSLIHLAQRLGGLSFGAVFVNLLVMLMLFNLVDLLIIDWLILGVLWRSLSVMPGTDPNLAGYSDWSFALKGFLKGSVGIFVSAVVLGAVIAGVYRLLA
jgi:hypothetical protein